MYRLIVVLYLLLMSCSSNTYSNSTYMCDRHYYYCMSRVEFNHRKHVLRRVAGRIACEEEQRECEVIYTPTK